MNNNAIKYLFFAILGIVLGYFFSKEFDNDKLINKTQEIECPCFNND